MPIEELTIEDVLMRCAACQTTTRSKLATLLLGVGSVGDDLDGRVLRLPPCPKCRAEEFLIRSDIETLSPQAAYGELHRLLVNQLHASLAKLGRFDARLKTPQLADLSAEVIKEHFPEGLKLRAPGQEKVDPRA